MDQNGADSNQQTLPINSSVISETSFFFYKLSPPVGTPGRGRGFPPQVPSGTREDLSGKPSFGQACQISVLTAPLHLYLYYGTWPSGSRLGLSSHHSPTNQETFKKKVLILIHIFDSLKTDLFLKFSQQCWFWETNTVPTSYSSKFKQAAQQPSLDSAEGCLKRTLLFCCFLVNILWL